MNKQQLKIKQINEQQKLKKIEQEKQNKKEKIVKNKNKINYKKYSLFLMIFVFVFIGFYYNNEIDNTIKKYLNIDMQKYLMGNATSNIGGFGGQQINYGSFINNSKEEIEIIEEKEKVCIVSKKENRKIEMNCVSQPNADKKGGLKKPD